MADQAPKSTRRVMRELQRTIIPDRWLQLMPIETRVASDRKAETTIGRPWRSEPFPVAADLDRAVSDALHRLPGEPRTHHITMGRMFTVEWDGIRAPI